MEKFIDILENQRVVIASNRLPVIFGTENGQLHLHPASGGLITAINPLLKKCGGVWMGWPGIIQEDKNKILELLEEQGKEIGYRFFPIFLTSEEVDLFYEGFSNKIIWPLFHDLQFKCQFNPAYWEEYKKVNTKFAASLLDFAKNGDFIWIHDYHLMLVARELRKQGVDERLTFFLHIPFAHLDIFMKIPWRFELLRSLLEFDFIGFQTMRDLRNFRQCISVLLPDVSIKKEGNHLLCTMGERKVIVGAFPISIDFDEFNSLASKQQTFEKVQFIKKSVDYRKIIFSIDRLDYTKGIPYRLKCIKRFLEKYPAMHQKVIFNQMVIPSRTDISEYQQLKEEIDREVSEINSHFTINAWVPIHYMYYPIPREDLIANYRAADVMLVTPIKDGMNLVVKEYIASNVEETGVVILSEFAGAASQLQGYSLLVNPYDVEGMADTIQQALEMSEEERKKRMKKLRNRVHKENIYLWVSQIISASKSKGCSSPVKSEYIPKEK